MGMSLTRFICTFDLAYPFLASKYSWYEHWIELIIMRERNELRGYMSFFSWIKFQ